MGNLKEFTVYIYANEYAFLKWLVLQKPFIETGGDLFGVWQNEACAVVQFVLGPGRQCERTTSSFHQDVSYLENVGGYLTSNEGLCNIGEWHSHHRIGLSYPSAGDQNTVWGHMSTVSGGRFLVFIANIRGIHSVQVGCFMFNSRTDKMTEGKLEILMNCSPLRHALTGRGHFTLEAEEGQSWDSFYMSKLKTAQRKPGTKVGNLELGVSYCVCDIEEEDTSCECCACLKKIVCYACCCFRSMFSACCRVVWGCLRWCLSGLVIARGRPPTRDY